MLVLHCQREWALICKEGSYSQHGHLFTKYNGNVSRTVSCQQSVVNTGNLVACHLTLSGG